MQIDMSKRQTIVSPAEFFELVEQYKEMSRLMQAHSGIWVEKEKYYLLTVADRDWDRAIQLKWGGTEQLSRIPYTDLMSGMNSLYGINKDHKGRSHRVMHLMYCVSKILYGLPNY